MPLCVQDYVFIFIPSEFIKKQNEKVLSKSIPTVILLLRPPTDCERLEVLHTRRQRKFDGESMVMSVS